jgi:Zn-finger nucleic acid-binding protein
MTEKPRVASMKCPACKSTPLEPRPLEPGLDASACPSCRGLLVTFEAYWSWRESLAETTTAPPVPEAPSAARSADEPTSAKLCPACGRFMTRLRTAGDLPFLVDRCGGCAAIWFDAGEWEVLRARGLHSRIHTFFSDSWQHRLRDQAAARQQEDRYRALLGEEVFERVREFKAWALPHPQRSIIFAFLEDRPTP